MKKVLLLNAAFVVAILDLISVHFIICYHATKMVGILYIFRFIWSIINRIVDCYLEILFTLVLSTLISFPEHIPVSVNLSITPCKTVFSSANSTSSSAYFTVRDACPPVLKFPKPSTVPLVTYSLCNSYLYREHITNRIGDKQNPCLPPLPLFTHLVSPLSIRIWTHCWPILFSNSWYNCSYSLN